MSRSTPASHYQNLVSGFLMLASLSVGSPGPEATGTRVPFSSARVSASSPARRAAQIGRPRRAVPQTKPA